ncbi:helix-turn-helix domain-containing protein [Escherichia coli]|uniref:helix-turn-helix domain-containing protein n=1 Tax=Enterobacteriaceae TaxID=543 RepID=UPI0005CCC4C4|nr:MULTISPECIES: helix-turn-helix domain-containing protein [Enterobacteriaceae]EBS1324067.1 helix-turn-helix domain-containing protein [Salmonella enterica subsp. enterica serovar Muenchen]EBY9279775.1 helix-turn-helix domain-containing protein [Salmonella enterica subsp. enterica serovar Denver]EKH5788034.1 helix-turn-helix domain-containing protein [Escherichia coli O8]ECD5428203.1 helix-turn-helix domain-containing protein [Salmonella enterica subsp. enterica serovar Denver]EFB7208321.1 he
MKKNNESAQYETSARRIKQVLYELGWNQSRLAKEIGVSAQAVQQWAKGTSRPNGPNLTRLSEVTSKPEAWFFSDVSGLSESHAVHLPESNGSDFLPLSDEEIRLLTVFRKFPSVESKNMLLAFEMRLQEIKEYYSKYANPNKNR